MYHSISFYDGTSKFNTYSDWHLVPETRPFVAPPEPKTKYLDIPGANGQIDLSDILTGYPVYNDREGEWTFYVLNDYSPNDFQSGWQQRYSAIMTAIQGRRLKIVLEDDPNYCYEGRVFVSEWESEDNFSKVTISYTLGAYKKPCTEHTRTVGGVTTVYLTVSSSGAML